MAGPVGHFVCAMAFINSGLSEISYKKDFFAGNVFPDIRYIAPIKRSATHFNNISLTSIIDEKNSFTKGHYLHIWLDKERESFMQRNNIYNFIEYKKYKSQIIKITEDYILFNQIKDLNINKIFNTTYNEELKHNLSSKNIYLWHELLKNYLNSTIINEIRYIKTIYFIATKLELEKKYLDKSYLYKFKKIIQALALGLYTSYKIYQLSNDKKFCNIVNEFYNIYLVKKLNTYKIISN